MSVLRPETLVRMRKADDLLTYLVVSSITLLALSLIHNFLAPYPLIPFEAASTLIKVTAGIAVVSCAISCIMLGVRKAHTHDVILPPEPDEREEDNKETKDSKDSKEVQSRGRGYTAAFVVFKQNQEADQAKAAAQSQSGVSAKKPPPASRSIGAAGTANLGKIRTYTLDFDEPTMAHMMSALEYRDLIPAFRLKFAPYRTPRAMRAFCQSRKFLGDQGQADLLHWLQESGITVLDAITCGAYNGLKLEDIIANFNEAQQKEWSSADQEGLRKLHEQSKDLLISLEQAVQYCALIGVKLEDVKKYFSQRNQEAWALEDLETHRNTYESNRTVPPEKIAEYAAMNKIPFNEIEKYLDEASTKAWKSKKVDDLSAAYERTAKLV